MTDISFNDDGELVVKEGDVLKKEDFVNYGKTNWRELLPNEVATHGSTANLKTIDDFGKTYLNAQGLVGKKGIVVPTESDPPELWAKYYKELGVPDSEEGYELADLEALKEKKIDLTESKKAFMKRMKEANVPNAAAKEAWKFHQDAILANRNKVEDMHKLNVSKAVEALQSEWGTEYDANIKRVQSVISMVAQEEPELMKIIDARGWKKDTAFAKVIYALTKDFTEDRLNVQTNPLEREATLNSWLAEQSANRDKSPFYNEHDPMHKQYVDKFNKLAAKAKKK